MLHLRHIYALHGPRHHIPRRVRFLIGKTALETVAGIACIRFSGEVAGARRRAGLTPAPSAATLCPVSLPALGSGIDGPDLF